MHRPRTSPAVVVGILIVVLGASLAAGWLIASRVSGGGEVATGIRPDPAEPPYDASDPLEATAEPADAAPPTPPPPPRPTADAAKTAASPAPDAVPVAPPEPPAPDTTTRQAPPVPPAPEPQPAPAPTPTPAPSVPEPSVAPYIPPPAIGIAAEALPPDGRAWAILTEARRSAPAGTQERADLDWIIAFARSAAAPGRTAGRRATARRALRANAWWFARRESPGKRVIARDPDGIILTYKRGHGFMVNPVATMGRWRGLNELWSPAQLAEAMLPMLVERVHDGREWAALEYFDVPGEPSTVRPGVSGMAQARAAALFSRAWSETRDQRFLEAARRVLRSFEVPVDDGGVLASVRDPGGGAPGTWYPERAYPGRDAWTGGALNGFMVSILELSRAAASLGGEAEQQAPGTAPATASTTPGTEAASPVAVADSSVGAAEARRLADRATRSLVRFIPLHDTGSWSYYGLLTPGKPWRSYLADLNYHCYHVSLLRSLARLYPGEGLETIADRWQGYVDARSATCPAR
jgi:outer membrane biosynthesis protein TonB